MDDETAVDDLGQRRRVAVVFNGRAGALLDRPNAVLGLEDVFAAAGLEPVFIPNDRGSLPERVQSAADTGARVVVVAGGDGTIACAAQVLAGTDIALGILPSGTMNLLAKDLGIPVDDMEAAVALVAQGTVRRVDVGEVGGRVFLCASMLGLPVKIGRQRERHRASGPAWRRFPTFAAAALRIVRNHLARRLVLEFDGRRLASRAPSITVVVNRLDDGADRLFARGCLDGGEFGVYLVRWPRWQELAPLAIDLIRGNWRAGGVVEECRASDLVIQARRRTIDIMLDGEAARLPTPLHYRLRRRALRVIAAAAVPG